MNRRILFCSLLVLIFQISCRHTETNNSSPLPVTNTSDPSQVNSLPSDGFKFNGVTRGCGNFLVYRVTSDGSKALRVNTNREELKVSPKPVTFNISNTRGLEVIIEDFGEDNYEDRQGYCYDNVSIRPLDPIRYTAISGNATIHTSSGSDKFTYKATVIIENAVFRNGEIGKEIVIPRAELKDVDVGWFAG